MVCVCVSCVLYGVCHVFCMVCVVLFYMVCICVYGDEAAPVCNHIPYIGHPQASRV